MDMDITKPGVYTVSTSWFGVDGASTHGWLPAFRAPLAGRYTIHGNADGVTGELVRVAADPPIFPHMRLR